MAEGPGPWVGWEKVSTPRDTGGDQGGPAHNGVSGLCPPLGDPAWKAWWGLLIKSARRAVGQEGFLVQMAFGTSFLEAGASGLQLSVVETVR